MDLIRDCLKSLMYDKARSFLAILSITVAVITLSLVMFISELAKLSLQQQISQMGTDLIIVYLESEKDLPRKWIELIQDEALIEMYSYVNQGSYFVAGSQYSIMEVEPTYFEMHNMSVYSGRLPYPSDSTLYEFYAVVGNELASNSFLKNGSINLFNNKYEVIGYLNGKGATLMGNDDEAIFIPYYRYRLNEPKMLQIKSRSEDSIEHTKLFLENYLGLFLLEEQISIYSEIQLKEGLNSITALLQQVLSFVASLSFLVSLIGIANVMIVSVKQREYEIGILRAIGASKIEIMTRFLLEAITIATIGFLVGYFFSTLFMIILASVLGAKYQFSFSILLTISFLSIITGLVAGIYPAYLATKKEIVESLHL